MEANEFTDGVVAAYHEAIEKARYLDQHSLLVQLEADLADYMRIYEIGEPGASSGEYES